VTAPRQAEVDLREAGPTRRLFERARPEVVYHLAARVGGIGANQAHPGGFFHDNMAMGLAVLEAARLTGVDKTVIVGTACMYPEATPVPFCEDDLWSGYPTPVTAPYGIAKKALLVMAQSYRQEYGTRSAFVIPSNLYGPRDHFDLETGHVVPSMIKKFLESKDRVVLWGDGTPTRELLYVEDCAAGILAAADRYHDPAPLNLGTGVETPMRELAATIARLCGFAGEIVWDTTRPNGQPRRALDAGRARRALAWSARTPLAEGLEKTITWYRDACSPS
jgi:GDP-L-fucose synthase